MEQKERRARRGKRRETRMRINQEERRGREDGQEETENVSGMWQE